MEHKRKGMKTRTGGSRRVEVKDQEQKVDGAKMAPKKSAKSKVKGGENGAEK